jgi:site-specific recombinase
MALIKAGIGRVTLAPFTQAFLYSMNYSFGFMLIHVMHFTLATKQPAMTAATIAATVDANAAPNSKGKAPLKGMVELIAMVTRTQLVSIFGNMLLSIPTGLAIAWAVGAALGEPVMTAEKAAHTLHELDSIASLAPFHAAIAGVWLFLFGLISGYYDNECAYNRIPARLRQLRGMRKVLGERLQDRFATYIENNLGALMGNFSLGILLGFTGMVGFMFGLPIDVLHVTLSSANFAFALVALNFAVSWQPIAWSSLGLVLVGLVNLGVSFSLALYVAMKARQVRFNPLGELLALLLQRFMASPRDFLLPPRTDAAVEAT